MSSAAEAVYSIRLTSSLIQKHTDEVNHCSFSYIIIYFLSNFKNTKRNMIKGPVIIVKAYGHSPQGCRPLRSVRAQKKKLQ